MEARYALRCMKRVSRRRWQPAPSDPVRRHRPRIAGPSAPGISTGVHSSRSGQARRMSGSCVRQDPGCRLPSPGVNTFTYSAVRSGLHPLDRLQYLEHAGAESCRPCIVGRATGARGGEGVLATGPPAADAPLPTRHPQRAGAAVRSTCSDFPDLVRRLPRACHPTRPGESRPR